MAVINVVVTGKKISREVEDSVLLSDFIRDNQALTGTHVGCDTSQCGACVVHLNGNSVKSCTALVADCDGSEITTIEGVADADGLHPIQQAFLENAALQCGICTPGFILASKALLESEPNPSEERIRLWLAGNLCRCTGYDKIVRAVIDASSKMPQP